MLTAVLNATTQWVAASCAVVPTLHGAVTLVHVQRQHEQHAAS